MAKDVKSMAYPFTGAKVRELRIGDLVSLSGWIVTGRDRLHKALCEGTRPPVELKDGAIFHCGPIMVRHDGQWRVLAAGPTTSLREEAYMAQIIEKHRVRVVIGKGGMGPDTLRACARAGCVYVQVVGGAACVLAQTVTEVKGVHFLKEFGPAEAMWEFVVRDLVGVVTMDSHGKSLHQRVGRASRRELKRLLG